MGSNRAHKRMDRMLEIMKKYNISLLGQATFPVVIFDTP
jgi:hypothetical protein